MENTGKEIILLELFSGIGGFAKAFDEAGFTILKHFFSEIDNHAIANYKYNFKNAEYIGSVTNVRYIIRTIKNARQSGQRLVITFGSPCQDFSLAGERKGLEGNRSSLIKFAIFLIKWLKPDVYIWENVKGAYSTNHGADFWAIIQAFANIDGYGFEQQLLNTAWFLPQNRERIYLIGHLAGRSRPGIFPITENGGLYNQTEQKNPGQIESSLNSNDIKSWVGNFIETPKKARTITGGGKSGGLHRNMEMIKQINPSIESGGKQPYQQNRIYCSEALIPSLLKDKSDLLIKANNSKGFEKINIGNSINISVPNSKTRRGRVGKGKAQTLDTASNQVVLVKPVLTPNRIEKRQNGRRFKENNDPSFTINSQDQHGVMINNSIRKLTEIECERLQGFTDNWTQYGIYEKQVWINKKEKTFKIIENVQVIPKTQRYKMIGNAVTVTVVKKIAEKLKLT